MIDNDVKKIAKVVKSEIAKALVPVHKKLDAHTAKLDAHTAKLDNHTAALMGIEATLEGYADMYKVNKDDNKKLKKRIDTIEEHLGLVPQE
ncbi:hypothetical protein A2697_02040 [Candidatus Curtissbacteria bacterium RIFCSPHIGHO2_01_FULL_41_44]|uniref:Uncharacterized protein n=1 Tax=Candidatus Curtissbacteria bacterium RIFCSPLOWO2_01_FULL_42_50 TaxID=1797730 RepID=A0A1F5H435_9BACT|nr:MAG: hypothetical protein A2697_02040 [Candidatus Curtissbacteria bacterium RIFCSPHIGHO2_01_FULL_41_44]OGD94640.1 MAG: hypothetical protein A3C33_01190 [Candidatus Curtissbacteria bacterium RIFCSPHIGHO2_02_FULL_42_58]OGD96953.1 MAG: hypothetical protein A3E71_00880 [Candidatus Curtissbacteria bacterium RIFCSPHIGHO2_12_FULL_42_33]OGD98805.1 MAG: hypothetical protein A3B54_03915 [Candidatus Curtissbacteria bacterium RIFCSPLOWO2_01_FULL_42_50]OGE02225.1 MAG: hypothetical protein A3G16_01055 [Ca